MIFFNELQKRYKKILLGGTILCYIIGTIIQIYYLTKFNALQFFSITQSISDGLYFLMYFIIYIVLPSIIVPMLMGKHDQGVNTGNFKSLIIVIFSFLVYLFPISLSFMNFPLLEIQQGGTVELKSILALIIPFSLFTVGHYLYSHFSQGDVKLPDLEKNKYKNIGYKIFYGLFLIFGFLNLFILMSGITFDFSSVNLSINLPLFTILLFSRSILISIESKTDSKSIFESYKFSIYGLYIFLLLVYTMISSVIYFVHFTKFSIKQYSNYGLLYLDNRGQFRVLYKNDKYVVATSSLVNTGNNIILPIDKVLYFETKITQGNDTIDNYIINFMKSFKNIKSVINCSKSYLNEIIMFYKPYFN